MDQLINRYRTSINPPYKFKDYLNLTLTLLLVLILPVTIFLAQRPQDIRQRAQEITKPHGKPETPSVPDEILVKFKPGVSEKAKDAVMKRYGITKKDSTDKLDVILAKVPEKAKDKVIKALSHNPRIEYVQPNYILNPLFVPNDPYYIPRQWNLKIIGAEQAWDISKGNPSVVVGVIDTGVYSGHPDLAGRLVAGKNFLDGSTNVPDQYGHGTMVTGLVTAATDNAHDIAGLASNNRVMPLKVAGADGQASDFDIAAAMIYAADTGVKVVTISFGGPGQDQVMQDGANYAWSKGVVTVAAAGNNGTCCILYPAAADHVIGVGGTDSSNGRLAGSALDDTDSNTPVALDVMAPGSNVFSTMNSGTQLGLDGIAGNTGTSFASPQVAALAALIMSANSSLTNQQVVDVIKNTAVDLGNPGWDQYFGFGRINASAALQMATGRILVDTTSPVLTGSTPFTPNSKNNTALSGTVTIGNIALSDDSGLVARFEIYVDNTLFGTLCTTGSSFPLDTTQVANGTHTITVKAYDPSNNVGQASQLFAFSNTVSNPFIAPAPVTCPTHTIPTLPPPDTQNPTVSITSPTDNATVTGLIDITASASDDTSRENAGVTKVEFYKDETLLATDYSPSYLTSWITTAADNGTHTITVKAYDAAGNIGTSSITVTVNNPVIDTTPPTVSLINLVDGQQVVGTVSIAATASDNVSVSSVSFLVDGGYLGEDTSSPYTIDWPTTTDFNGTHTIKAVAVDSSDNTGESITITVTVNNPNPPTPTPTATPFPSPTPIPTEPPLPTSPAVTPTLVPQTNGVTLSSISAQTFATSATVNWVTDIASSSRVAYGTSAANLNFSTVENTTSVMNHSVSIGSLSPNTRYYYKVISKNSLGDEFSSFVKNFKTKSR